MQGASYSLSNPKFYIAKSGWAQISTSNDHISETKRNILDPLVPKFSSHWGLSPAPSWKWPSSTLSPSFGLFQSEKPLSRGVPGCPQLPSSVRICPRDRFPTRRKKFTWRPILLDAVWILWSLSLRYFHSFSLRLPENTYILTNLAQKITFRFIQLLVLEPPNRVIC